MAINEPAEIPTSLLTTALASRLKFYPEADPELIRGMSCGIIFIMSFWSGPARKVYPAFIEAVERGDPMGVLEVAVVDNDGTVEWDSFPEIHDIRGGFGEVVAVHEGRILATSGLGLQPETYRGIVASLIYTCGQSPTTPSWKCCAG